VWNVGDGSSTIHYHNTDLKAGTIRFGNGVLPENVEVRNSGENVVFALLNAPGGMTFVGGNKVDAAYHPARVVFADKTVWRWRDVVGRKVVRGDNYNNTLYTASLPGEKVIVYGLGGNDTIYGGSGDDTFIPGPGSNVIYARSDVEGGGKKTFVWNKGDGNSTIYYYNANRVVNDGMAILRFGSDIAPAHVEARNSGDNVVFAVNAAGFVGNITFVNANKSDPCYQMDEIQFTDGETWKWSDVVGSKVVRGDNNNNVLYTSSLPGEKVTVYGFGGNDTIYGGAGDDTFVPGPGGNVIWARSNVEGGGNKTFVWNIGDGSSTINYYNATHQPGDGMGILRLGSDITPEDVEVRNNAGNVVFVITTPSGIGQMTFVGANTTDVRYHLDEVQFLEGTVWNWVDVQTRKVVRGDNNNNVLYASSLPGEKVTIYGLGGNDTIYGGAGDDTFVPGSGSNTVFARSNEEGGGSKTFVWNIGDGHSAVHYYSETHQPGDGMGVLRYGSGVSSSNVVVKDSGNNVVFSHGGANITFVGANTNDARYHLDEIRFADGEVWTWSTMPRQ